MLTIACESTGRFCDRVNRRDMLRIGALGLGFGSLNLADILQAEAQADNRSVNCTNQVFAFAVLSGFCS